MVKVSLQWILDCCWKIVGSGGLIHKDNINEYLDVTKRHNAFLTLREMRQVEMGQRERKFVVSIEGHGLIECFPFTGSKM